MLLNSNQTNERLLLINDHWRHLHLSHKLRKCELKSKKFPLTNCLFKLAASPRTGLCILSMEDSSVSFLITHSVISLNDNSKAFQCSEFDSNRFLLKIEIASLKETLLKDFIMKRSITMMKHLDSI